MVLYKDSQPWEKPWQHILKKYDTFWRVFDIANQLLTRHSPFAPLRLNPRSFFEIFSGYGC